MDTTGEDIYGFAFALVTGITMGIFIGLAIAQYLTAIGMW